jgi:DNA-binding response OmpR family regulator
MNVLVVEDEAMIRMLVCDLLEEAGHDCVGVADAEHALMLLDSGQYRPDFLVSDFNLGLGLNGKALACEVQRRLPGLPTVFVTGNPECFTDYLFQPWERLVAKPFAGAELLLALHGLRSANHAIHIWSTGGATQAAALPAAPYILRDSYSQACRHGLELGQ